MTQRPSVGASKKAHPHYFANRLPDADFKPSCLAPTRCIEKFLCIILVHSTEFYPIEFPAKPYFYWPVAIFRKWHIFCPFSDTLLLARLAPMILHEGGERRMGSGKIAFY